MSDWDSMDRVVAQICSSAFETLGQDFAPHGQAFQTFSQAFDFLFRLQKLGRVIERLHSIF